MATKERRKSASQKSRKSAKTDEYEMVSFQISPELLDAVMRYGRKHDESNRSAILRALIRIGLKNG